MWKKTVVSAWVLTAPSSGQEATCAGGSCEEDEVVAQRVSLFQSKSEVRSQSGGKLCPESASPRPSEESGVWETAWPARPTSPVQYNGVQWPSMCIEKKDEYHFFLFGDYGGITCGKGNQSHDPNGWTCGRPKRSDPHRTYARTADNTKDHPDRGRYMHHGIDDQAQPLVAKYMQVYASKLHPDYVLSGGDNFYFGGLSGWGLSCCQPMDQMHQRTLTQFRHVFEEMYGGEDLKIPFFSCFGNHDFGGRMFDAAWDQQIAYTWAEEEQATKRWIFPSFYYATRINYPGDNFTIDVYMLDTNKGDAKPWTHDAGHNICGTFNQGGASCAKCGGMPNRYKCQDWFGKLWHEQDEWLNKHLEKSDADWQIIVSHFPPDQYQGRYWGKMYKRHGIDLFVGSHRHSQELHLHDRRFGGLSYVVCGGGGGITSEWNPDRGHRGRQQYGFMDVKITKTEMLVTSINYHGDIVDKGTVTPRPGQGELSCKHYGCGIGNTKESDWQGCACDANCFQKNNCCKDFSKTCPDLARCELYGCNSRYDRRKTCQCTKDCADHGTCCADFEEKCKPSCDNYACGDGKRWQSCSCASDCWKGGRGKNKCCEDFSDKCTNMTSCKEYGCFGRYERKRPCQCTTDCEEHDSCCTDFKDVCDTPEMKAAMESCSTKCEVEGEDGDFPCDERIKYLVQRKHKPLSEAMETVNTNCKDKCACTENVLKAKGFSLLQDFEEDEETASKREELEAHRQQLLDELDGIEQDLDAQDVDADILED